MTNAHGFLSTLRLPSLAVLLAAFAATACSGTSADPFAFESKGRGATRPTEGEGENGASGEGAVVQGGTAGGTSGTSTGSTAGGTAGTSTSGGTTGTTGTTGGGTTGGAAADAGADAAPSDDYDWHADLVLTPVPAAAWSGDDYGSPHLADVMGHTTDRYLSSTFTTNAHETMHGLLNEMRNKKGAGWGFFYYENGQGAYVEEPQMAASLIKNYVPAGAKTLAQSRYNLYLVQQVASWTEVLYQFDEWCSYKTNARVAVEGYEAGRWNLSNTDEVDGAMDFLVFAAAAVRGLEQNEPAYLQNKQFKATFAMLAEESMTYINKGLALAPFSGFHGAALRDHLRTSPESAALRTTLQTWLGKGWTRRVLGF